MGDVDDDDDDGGDDDDDDVCVCVGRKFVSR